MKHMIFLWKFKVGQCGYRESFQFVKREYVHSLVFTPEENWINIYYIVYKYIPQVKLSITNHKHFELKVFKYCSF